VTRQKTFGIVFPNFKDGAGSRNVSDKRFQLVNGTPVPNDEMTAAIQGSIGKTIVSLREKIGKELQ
ncbi:MAG TPA: hypothetical protein DCS07_05805, partial [Bdellovibrionales bacterium]|nr:hypothetical protein [Bdellovibrionales bacterium]